MEKKHVITEPNSRFFALRDAYLFNWELLEEKSIGEKVELFLQRDNQTKHYSELIKLKNLILRCHPFQCGRYLF